MADAKQCDRCGALYKLLLPGVYYITERENLIDYQYELCPVCRVSFKRWFKGDKPKGGESE